MNWQINYQLPDGLKALKVRTGFPSLKDAVIDCGQEMMREWRKQAEALINRASGEYINSIQPPKIIDDGMGAEVINIARYAKWIELGRAGFRLPEKVNWQSSPGVKRGKKGPYLIIPFQHMTPAKGTDPGGATYHHKKIQMPKEIYDFSVKLTRSLDIAKKNQPMLNPRTGHLNTSTLWGGRIVQHGQSLLMKEFHKDRPPTYTKIGDYGEKQFIGGRAGLFESQRQHWKFSKFAGMTKVGAAKHTRYMTFRIMTPNSPGWYIPAMDAKHIAERATKEVIPRLKEIVLEAILRDVRFE